ncbi:hypothetical protein ACX8XN_15415 [Calditrichota bacterium GD2]
MFYKILFTLTIITHVVLSSCTKGEAELKVSTNQLDFGSDEVEKEFIIENSGKENGIFEFGVEQLKYKIMRPNDVNWISVNPAFGTCDDEKDIITVTINRDSIRVGSFNQEIYIFSNGGDKAISVITTQEALPGPSHPSPINNSTNQELSLNLTWACSKAYSFDLFFGTQNPPTVKYLENSKSNNYYVRNLEAGKTYYWQVIANYAKVINGDTVSYYWKQVPGKVWRFTTINWTNLYPELQDKLPNFRNKYFNRNKDLTVLILGDSYISRQRHTTYWPEELHPKLPPQMQSQNLAYYIWATLVKNKPKYDRFDSDLVFKEYGDFLTYEQNEAWDECWINNIFNGYVGTRDDGSITRFSISKNAYIEFSWDLSKYEKCNFIYRSDTLAEDNVLVTVSGGPGQIKIEGDIEAHNYRFSMYEQNSRNYGWGNSIYLKRLKFQRVSNMGVVKVRLSKGSNSKRLLYWGIEKYNGYTIFVINIARGSHNFYRPPNNLDRFIENDLFGRNPDLIILEQCINNTPSSSWEYAYDFVWGDRPGFANPNSLKKRSNNWQDFEIFTYLPHWPNSYFVDGKINEKYMSDWNKTKELFLEKNDVPFIDMANVFIKEAKNKGWNYGEATVGSGVIGNTFTSDNLHPNDTGTLIYRRHILPVLNFTTSE